MADDEITEDIEDEYADPEEVEEDPEVELDEADLDVEDLEAVIVVDDDDDEVVDDVEDEDEVVVDTPRTRRKKRDDDEDDDDEELLADDDVEADLDKILKDRMVTVEEDDDEEEDVDVRGDGAERLHPKQQDEQLCPSCFLLVRASAPNCPVGDDDCPIFSS